MYTWSNGFALFLRQQKNDNVMCIAKLAGLIWKLKLKCSLERKDTILLKLYLEKNVGIWVMKVTCGR